LERDDLSAEAKRKGVPQANHPHVLLAAGAELIEQLLPGVFARVTAGGGLCLDTSSGNNWYHFSTWKRRLDSGILVRLQSRALLESAVRTETLAQPNVEIVRANVANVTWPDSGPSVRVVTSDGSEVLGELLVDASGRGSHLPRWLERAGYQPPREERVGMDLDFVSAQYRSDAARDWVGILIYPDPPSGRRAGGALPMENGLLQVWMTAWGESVKADDDHFLQFSRTLPQPELAQFLESAERVTDFSANKFKWASFRHYEGLRRFAPATVVVGDAYCCFDPVFGQGITTAAMAADLLQRSAATVSSPSELAALYRAQMRPVVSGAWELSTTEDLRYPDVVGKRPFGIGLAHAYVRRVQQLSGLDDDVYLRFLRVLHMTAPKTVLFAPSVVLKVLGSFFSGARAARSRPTDTE
jgi:2-polyprenyl-6-methoxyphenol hydroxylase-like FAD-dependent oxidoreductase